MTVTEEIRARLTAVFAPAELEVVDDSERHRGHAGYREGGESHFRVEVVAAAFDGQSRVARQRMVYGVLAEEMREQIHALALTTRTPEEDQKTA